MPRPQRDGTPARSPNRRKLSDAFVRTVQPDPGRIIVVWDTLQRGLALAVQPSGHLAWKCVYTIRGRGPRWYHMGNAGAITLADARKLASKILYQVAEGADPHADRLALRGRGSFEQVARRYVEEHAKKRNKSWRQADALVTKYLLPRWGKLDIGNIRRTDVKAAIAAIAAPVLANQVLAAASPIFSWATRQELISANPCAGVEKNDTTSRERVLSDNDLRRTFCSKVTALGFGRDAMNRVTNHKEGGIADVYDRHRYSEENKKIMETVARHIVTIAEPDGPANVVALAARR